MDRVYKDVISSNHDVLFTSDHPKKLVHGGLLYQVEGKYISNMFLRKTNVDIIIFGNLMPYKFQSPSKLQEWMDVYIQKVIDHLRATKPERVDYFKEYSKGAVQMIIDNFYKFHYYTGKSCAINSGLGFLSYHNDGTPYMLFFTDGLQEDTNTS